MDITDFGGLELNIAAVIIAQILSTELEDNEMTILANFLYTIADCMNTLVNTGS